MRPGPGLVVMALAFISGARRGSTSTNSKTSTSSSRLSSPSLTSTSTSTSKPASPSLSSDSLEYAPFSASIIFPLYLGGGGLLPSTLSSSNTHQRARERERDRNRDRHRYGDRDRDRARDIESERQRYNEPYRDRDRDRATDRLSDDHNHNYQLHHSNYPPPAFVLPIQLQKQYDDTRSPPAPAPASSPQSLQLHNNLETLALVGPPGIRAYRQRNRITRSISSDQPVTGGGISVSVSVGGSGVNNKAGIPRTPLDDDTSDSSTADSSSGNGGASAEGLPVHFPAHSVDSSRSFDEDDILALVAEDDLLSEESFDRLTSLTDDRIGYINEEDYSGTAVDGDREHDRDRDSDGSSDIGIDGSGGSGIESDSSYADNEPQSQHQHHQRQQQQQQPLSEHHSTDYTVRVGSNGISVGIGIADGDSDSDGDDKETIESAYAAHLIGDNTNVAALVERAGQTSVEKKTHSVEESSVHNSNVHTDLRRSIFESASPLTRLNPWVSACDLAQPGSAPDLQGQCSAGTLPVAWVDEGPGPPTCPKSCAQLRLDKMANMNNFNMKSNNNYNIIINNNNNNKNNNNKVKYFINPNTNNAKLNNYYNSHNNNNNMNTNRITKTRRDVNVKQHRNVENDSDVDVDVDIDGENENDIDGMHIEQQPQSAQTVIKPTTTTYVTTAADEAAAAAVTVSPAATTTTAATAAATASSGHGQAPKETDGNDNDDMLLLPLQNVQHWNANKYELKYSHLRQQQPDNSYSYRSSSSSRSDDDNNNNSNNSNKQKRADREQRNYDNKNNKNNNEIEKAKVAAKDNSRNSNSNNNNNYKNNNNNNIIDNTDDNDDDEQQCLDYLGDTIETSPTHLCGLRSPVELMTRLRTLRLRHCCERNVFSALHTYALNATLSGGVECVRVLMDIMDLDALATRITCELAEILFRFDCRQVYSLIHQCDDCKEAYRRWVCSTLVPYFAEPSDIILPPPSEESSSSSSSSSNNKNNNNYNTNANAKANSNVNNNSNSTKATKTITTTSNFNTTTIKGNEPINKRTSRSSYITANGNSNRSNNERDNDSNDIENDNDDDDDDDDDARDKNSVAHYKKKKKKVKKREVEVKNVATSATTTFYNVIGYNNNNNNNNNSTSNYNNNKKFSKNNDADGRCVRKIQNVNNKHALNSSYNNKNNNSNNNKRNNNYFISTANSEDPMCHEDPVISKLLKRSKRKVEFRKRRRIRPCLSVCQTVEQKCPYLLPADRAPALPTQYAGEPTFLCLDQNIPETGEQLRKSSYGPADCCYSYCGDTLSGLCTYCTEFALEDSERELTAAAAAYNNTRRVHNITMTATHTNAQHHRIDATRLGAMLANDTRARAATIAIALKNDSSLLLSSPSSTALSRHVLERLPYYAYYEGTYYYDDDMPEQAISGDCPPVPSVTSRCTIPYYASAARAQVRPSRQPLLLLWLSALFCLLSSSTLQWRATCRAQYKARNRSTRGAVDVEAEWRKRSRMRSHKLLSTNTTMLQATITINTRKHDNSSSSSCSVNDYDIDNDSEGKSKCSSKSSHRSNRSSVAFSHLLVNYSQTSSCKCSCSCKSNSSSSSKETLNCCTIVQQIIHTNYNNSNTNTIDANTNNYVNDNDNDKIYNYDYQYHYVYDNTNNTVTVLIMHYNKVAAADSPYNPATPNTRIRARVRRMQSIVKHTNQLHHQFQYHLHHLQHHHHAQQRVQLPMTTTTTTTTQRDYTQNFRVNDWWRRWWLNGKS